MRELSIVEVEDVNGGLTTGTALGVAGIWVGTVASVGLAVVGAPVLAGAAVGLVFGGLLLTACSLI